MRIIGACALTLLAGAALCFAQAEKPRAVTPTVTYLEGSVSIDGSEASIGDTVPLGSVVSTAAGSLVDIEFSERNVIRLSENTTLVFKPHNLQTGSELRQGALTLVLKRLLAGGSGESLLVRTPSAVAGVRGTSYYMKVESPSSTYVCACNGVVQVLGADGSLLKELAATHHKAVKIEGTVSAPQITDAPRLYHTDEDVEKVASVIGYTIQWNVIDQ